MIGAILSFTLMAVAGRSVLETHDTFEVMAFRSVIGVLIVGGFAIATGRAGAIRTQRLGLHSLRNIAHFTGQNLWFYALTLIPLAQVFAMEFTSPLWVLLLSPFLLAERVRGLQYLAALVGFCGILVVAQPFSGSIDIGLVFAAAAAFFFALTAVLTRKLTRTESLVGILFWLTALQLIFGFIACFYDGAITWPTLATLPWLVVIGIAGLCAHLCLTTALGLAPASTVMPMDFIRLPVIAVIGALLYQETLEANVALGAALIIAGSWANLRIASKQRT
jgi:drug/metabolite transporter (DMT)-like permease